MNLIKHITVFSLFALAISSCGVGQNKSTILSASPLLINTPTSTKTILPTVTPTSTPTIFDSNDADLYDNFNDRVYDGGINTELWSFDSNESPDIIQKEGILSINKRSGTQECSSVSVNKYHGTEPQTPFYFQTDIKVEKQSPNSIVAIGIDGIVHEKSFMSTCGISTNSNNSTNAGCFNHWYINDYNLPEHKYFPVFEPNIINQWSTFRIDYDPRVTTFTYFIDNEEFGSYQVIDSESMKKAAFELRLVICAPQELTIKGYFDNVRLGNHYQ